MRDLGNIGDVFSDLKVWGRRIEGFGLRREERDR
jgi:hypothetical protein